MGCLEIVPHVLWILIKTKVEPGMETVDIGQRQNVKDYEKIV